MIGYQKPAGTKYFYWACVCGQSPIETVSGGRYFDSKESAQSAGKPEKCSNRYCSRHKIELHWAVHRPFEVPKGFGDTFGKVD